jgi:cell pole-organizing protein PopZ
MSDNSGQNDPQMKDILGSIRRIISEDNEQPAAAEGGEEEEILDLTEEVAADEVGDRRLDPTAGMADEEAEPEIRREPVLGLHNPTPPAAEPVLEQPESMAGHAAPPVQEPSEAAEQDMDTTPDENAPIPMPSKMMRETETTVEEAPQAEPEPVVEPAPEAGEEAIREIVSETATIATATALGELTRAMDENTNKLKVGSGETSIADMVKELIRPMLREWLDENLPGIVERVVRREIQKLVDRAEPED